MAIFDDETLTPKRSHEIGQDLSLMSADELAARIEILRREIDRLEAERVAKGASKAAAEAFFRR